MGRPPKAVSVLEAEGKSHRTKAELAARSAAEEALLTGQKLKMQADVKADPIASREFRRVAKLMTAIKKNDALYSAIINRYCKLFSECAELEQDIANTRDELIALDEAELDPEDKFKIRASLRSSIVSADRQIQSKRKMMLDIEKECAMTVAAALRSIPKEPEPKSDNPLIGLLSDAED